MMAAATIVVGTFVDVYGENTHNISYKTQSLVAYMCTRYLGSVAIRMLRLYM